MLSAKTPFPKKVTSEVLGEQGFSGGCCSTLHRGSDLVTAVGGGGQAPFVPEEGAVPRRGTALPPPSWGPGKGAPSFLPCSFFSLFCLGGCLPSGGQGGKNGPLPGSGVHWPWGSLKCRAAVRLRPCRPCRVTGLLATWGRGSRKGA